MSFCFFTIYLPHLLPDNIQHAEDLADPWPQPNLRCPPPTSIGTRLLRFNRELSFSPPFARRLLMKFVNSRSALFHEEDYMGRLFRPKQMTEARLELKDPPPGVVQITS